MGRDSPFKKKKIWGEIQVLGRCLCAERVFKGSFKKLNKDFVLFSFLFFCFLNDLNKVFVNKRLGD